VYTIKIENAITYKEKEILLKENISYQDEPALIEAARSDSDAFSILYQRYLTPVYRYLLRRLNNVHDAEDLTTVVFTEVLEGLVSHRYREGGCFAAWIFTIARRRLIDFYRQQPEAPLNDPPSPEPGLLTSVEKGEDLDHLEQLLTQLDEQHQELLRLRFSAGLSFTEIGKLEKRSEAAVKMALYRTLDYLRAHWEDENG
jgi:RNA polymerase sigma-70 factor (ECF subfamily)